MPVGLVHVGAYFGKPRVRCNARRDCDMGLDAYFLPHLRDHICGVHIVSDAIFGDVEICLVDAGTLKAWVVLGQNLTHLGCFRVVLVKIERDEDEFRTQLLGHKGGHATPTPKSACLIVAGCENTATHGEGEVLQFWGVQLLDGGIESIAVKVHNVLRQIARDFELTKQVICSPKLAREIHCLEAALLGKNGFNPDGKRLVPRFLVIEKLGPL